MIGRPTLYPLKAEGPPPRATLLPTDDAQTSATNEQGGRSMPDQSDGPFCECGECDATGREEGSEIRLPVEAWAVAGAGNSTRYAVLPAHVALMDPQPKIVVHHQGWAEVG